MTKNNLKKDDKFIERCKKYGLYPENCEVYGDIILMYTPINNKYILFDKNYNTIGVETFQSEDYEKELNSFYTKYNDNNQFKLIYPFNSYSLKEIIDLSDMINIGKQYNYDGLHDLICINNIYISENGYEDRTYLELLSYIKFLGEQIQEYFLIKYRMEILNFEMPDINTYLKEIVGHLDNLVNFYINHKIRLRSEYILSSFGKEYNKENCDLCDVSTLLMKDKGYVAKKEFPEEIEKINNDTINLEEYANKLKKLLQLKNNEYNSEKISVTLENLRENLEKNENNILTYSKCSISKS